MTPSSALTLNELRFSYKSQWTTKQFEVLKGITLEVGEGETFGFLGHNGAGKTTTIKCVLDLIRLTSGAIELFGVEHHHPQARQSIGYLPEQPYFYDHLSIRELVSMYAHLSGVAHRDVPGAVSTALGRVGMEQRAGDRMHSLSKGLMQRVAMAQALVAKPKLLILDEPFSGLDPIGRKEFKDLLAEEKEKGTTIFVSSHILEDIEYLCDRVSIMAHGELKTVLPIAALSDHAHERFELFLEKEEEPRELSGAKPQEVLQQNLVRYVFSDKKDAESALSQALASSKHVVSYGKVRRTLEELFVELVGGKE